MAVGRARDNRGREFAADVHCPGGAARYSALYLAMLGLAAWSIGALLGQANVAVFGALFSARTPVRGISVYMWTVVALNTATWLARIIPAVARGGAPGYLRGTGLTVNVVYVQDLALWLPLLAVAAAWLWRRRPWGYLLAGAGLVMWVLESASIAADQWYGHAAAPASPVASGALVPAFAALAVIGLIPAGLLLHGLSGGVPGVTAAPRLPVAARRGRYPWVLAGLDGLTGAAAVYGGAGLIRDGFGMPDGWLAGTPLTGWVLPGVALLIGVAVPQLAAAALIAAGVRPGLAAGLPGRAAPDRVDRGGAADPAAVLLPAAGHRRHRRRRDPARLALEVEGMKRIVILGGGTGGTLLANRLRRAYRPEAADIVRGGPRRRPRVPAGIAVRPVRPGRRAADNPPARAATA